MGLKLEGKEGEEIPAPGTYEIKADGSKIAYTMGQKYVIKEGEELPGPGTYNSEGQLVTSTAQPNEGS